MFLLQVCTVPHLILVWDCPTGSGQACSSLRYLKARYGMSWDSQLLLYLLTAMGRTAGFIWLARPFLSVNRLA